MRFIVELTKYLMLLMVGAFTYHSIRVSVGKNAGNHKRSLKWMTVFLFMFHFTGYFTMYMQVENSRLLWLYVAETLVFVLVFILHWFIYPGKSRLLLLNMMMFLSIGYIILARLSFDKAVRQFIISAASLCVGIFIPALMQRLARIREFGWIYGLAGFVLLILVLAVGTENYGAKSWLDLFGFISFQPTEFVKLLYVLCIASLYKDGADFKRVCLVTLSAAAMVLAIVFQKDLGGALIFFVTYVFMLYAAAEKPLYMLFGLAGGSAASWVAYNLFDHVKVRVLVWQNPFGYIDNEGYQISQSLFAIGTGGWFGMGLFQGLPTTIPVVDSDFIFSAIAEEFGGLFSLCLILLYINCFMILMNISLKLEDRFGGLMTLGFSVMFIFQVFLCIGGVIKFIPSTGVTLPLISYGGSSMVATIIMFMLIQGINDKPDKPAKPVGGKTILSVVYIFTGLFVLMMGYFAYFLLAKSEHVINSTYNLRHDVLSKRVLRGKIMSADGVVLAETVTDEEGNETRYYPYGDMYAHVVGRVMRGRSGIEEVENITLLTSYGNSAKAMYNDIMGVKNPGNNVITTLNSKLTEAAYEALGDNRGAVVVLEPKTGKILAMVSKPSYDPNTIDEDWEKLAEDLGSESPLLNRASQGLYPPGSTFKVLTTLAYIRANPDYMDFSYDCSGSIEYGGMIIKCSSGRAHGHVDLEEAFAKSCNTAYSKIAQSLSIADFRGLCESFFFNKSLPARIVNNPSRFLLAVGESGVKETMQTAIGQGRTLISPLHNAMIAAAVANGGVMMKPYVIDRVETAGGRVIKGYVPEEAAEVMTAKEADYLKSIMRSVVTEGTASKLNDLKVKAAGKTGTAEQEGKEPHAWFIGFAPVNDPEIAISVIVENKGSGSEYAIPIAEKVFSAYFK